MEQAYHPPRRAHTPDPPSRWVPIDSNPTSILNPPFSHLSLPKARQTFVMARHGSDDHHERRRESKLGFSGLSGLVHSHTLGNSRRRRPEHGSHQYHTSETLPDALQEPNDNRNRDRAHAHPFTQPLRDERNEHVRTMHHKFASEGWPSEDDGGSRLGRRISTLRGGNGISSWRSMRKHVSAAAHAAAESLRTPPTVPGGGRYPVRSTLQSMHAPSAASVVAPAASTVELVPEGGRHSQRSNYQASLAPSRPHTQQPEAPPPLPTRPTFARRASFGSSTSTYTGDNASLHAHHYNRSHHTPSFASSAPSVAPSVAPSTSTVSDVDGSETGHRTGSARHHTLAHVRNSTTSIHHYQPSEASLTSSPQSVKSPLSPVTPRSPYGPCIGSLNKRTMSRTFRQPNIDEVLPFASSPFAAWDPVAIDAEENGKPVSKRPGSEASGAGWRDVRAKGSTKARRVWCDAKGKDACITYKVGWEREVLDLESRLHETMYEVARGRHSFVEGEPATVLDLGTGTGLWPISAALQWRSARIIGADIVPCQIDVQALAAAETRARTSVSGEADGLGVWASVAARVSFQQFNFLEGLPYDSGVFDMVHIRFVGLGVPETHWPQLLDEAVRVLRPGGVLEIIEMSCEPPPSAPPSVANSFASQLLSDFIPQNPVLALQMHLPATAAVSQGSTRPLFQTTWSGTEDDYFSVGPWGGPRGAAPPAIADAASVWIRSSLSYRGTGLKALRDSGTGLRAVSELAAFDPHRWGAVPRTTEEEEKEEKEGEEGEDQPARPPAGGGRISLAVWVAAKM
ncbi:hypothetical protein CcaverHIS002_0203190 [Cutaneotrichosporon cavernicola]|uniref:Methyltransferase domain-containing protein n=1 Tax=Cutaneotrichosporon cavernicola TaxID=279322 RepID=A0AA48KZS6_9TREE|nr:uncharacterized protein CcaverHIS019_0203180 [Cutaneotrichosporon cavernicola]BEI81159.1 hypothetical protein CcaverHIS002_0203190 [Cutaneotrichosporon cavernicola]BEI88956.1 hypothetical protein CcaverHIS019_0203180 [Cutaneotrichosporon cavernicola]BEI96733.1 hypothetical protein CcaverHIS631_0203220 [Cutaneotrichosporon cavernicola]BEJ04505.1 hypothetical protein CcaverHIS641_0203220 [Cutaneotrichosporon cavernicola]